MAIHEAPSFLYIDEVLGDPAYELHEYHRAAAFGQREGLSLEEIGEKIGFSTDIVGEFYAEVLESAIKLRNKASRFQGSYQPFHCRIEDVLADKEFLKWFFKYFGKRDDETTIAKFKDDLENLEMTQIQRQAILAHEPFGEPILNAQMALTEYGNDSPYSRHRIRNAFFNSLIKLDKLGYDYSYILMPEEGATIRGIGCSMAGLTPTELMLTHSIPWYTNSPPVSMTDLGRALKQDYQWDRIKAAHHAHVHLHRLKSKIPRHLPLEESKYRGATYLRWGIRETNNLGADERT